MPYLSARAYIHALVLSSISSNEEHRILIPDSLLIVLHVISSAVFLSVRPSLIAVGFGLSVQLLSRGFSFRHDGGEGGRWKREKEGEGGRRREKEGEEAGKHALLIKLQA
jgi:hypothetical protein